MTLADTARAADAPEEQAGTTNTSSRSTPLSLVSASSYVRFRSKTSSHASNINKSRSADTIANTNDSVKTNLSTSIRDERAMDSHTVFFCDGKILVKMSYLGVSSLCTSNIK